MRARHLPLIVVVVALFGCAEQAPSMGAGPELEALLPEPSSLEGWRIAEGPSSYTPDSLWEYLDGGAPQYTAYGLERMLHVRYQLGNDPLASVTADVYDMGSDLGAFGIYSSIRPTTVAVRSWGADGYSSGTVAAAWKGKVFVHATADDDQPELIEMLEGLMSHIFEGAVGAVSPPTILRPLPPEGLVPQSQRYVATDLLGHAALGGGVLASYEIDGRRGKLFFSELESDVAAAEALTALRRERERWADVVDQDTAAGRTGFRFQEPDAGTGTVVRAGKYVAGVQGDLTFEEQEDLLERLAGRLSLSSGR